MSYSNTTEKLKLPQWSNTDMANWTPDLNEAFEKIDAYASTTDNAAELARQDITDIQTDIDGLKNKDKSIEADITALQEKDVAQDEDAQQTKTTLSKAVSDIRDLQTDSNEHDTAITALQNKDQDLDAHVGLNTQNINDIKESNNYKFFDKINSLTNANINYVFSNDNTPADDEGGHNSHGKDTNLPYFLILAMRVTLKNNDILPFPPVFLPGLNPGDSYDLEKMYESFPQTQDLQNTGALVQGSDTGLKLNFSEKKGHYYLSVNPERKNNNEKAVSAMMSVTEIYLD